MGMCRGSQTTIGLLYPGGSPFRCGAPIADGAITWRDKCRITGPTSVKGSRPFTIIIVIEPVKPVEKTADIALQ